MRRTIKSYVLRGGRMSQRQRQGLDHYLADYKLPEPHAYWNLSQEFGRDADTIIEVGFGMGGSLLEMAKAQPETNFVGIEVHQPGIGRLAADLHDQAIKNVRIAPYDARDVLKASVLDNSLAGVQIFFPDPWPKKKHHKRRLIQPEFIQRLLKKIKIGGFIHCATDWEDYAMHMLEVLSNEETLENQASNAGFASRPARRPLTKFEQRGMSMGHGVWDLIYCRQT